MKGKPIRGKGFGGGLRYTFRVGKKAEASDKPPRIVGGNMAGRSAEELTREFGAVRRLRPDVEQPVWHCPLSLTMGESVSDETWDQITRDLMIEMEFNPDIFPYVPILHEEKYQHSHLWASRIGIDGTVWHGKWEAFRVIEACQRLEKRYGLVLTAGLSGKDDEAAKGNRKPRVADAQAILNANKVKGTRKVDTTECAGLLLDCAKRSSDLPTFTQAALAVGIAVKPNRSETTGRISGLSVIPPGRKRFQALGDATGKKLTWPKLLTILDQNDQAADAARMAARVVVDAADRHAADRVGVRLDKQPVSVPHRARALAPAAIEAAKEATMNITDDKLDFLTPPPESRPFGQRLDDVPVGAASPSRAITDKREALDRNDRERVAANAAVEEELQSATKTQLKRLRDSLAGELEAHDAEAIEQILARFTRLVLRLLTLNQVVLPPTESERRVHVTRHSLKLVDAEIHRRAEVKVRDPAASQPPRVPRVPRTLPAQEKFQIVRAHDPRQPPLDRDEVARKQDAERERNRK